jgi:hypothetical protein
VVALVVGFMTELFYFGGSTHFDFGGKAAAVSANQTGTAEFTGSIRTYDPVLQIPGNTSQSVVQALRTMQGVKDVKVQNDVDLIQTETRDDVYPVAVALRQMNVSDILSIANIAVPETLTVSTDGGAINASTINVAGIVQVVAEPLVDSGNDVPVSMNVVVRDGLLIDYYGARILAERKSVAVNATVVEFANATYTYRIPWAGRSGIDRGRLNDSGYSYAYNQVNTFLLSPPLNVTGVLLKKQLAYVTFIDTGSAEAAANFSDEAAVRADFAETNVTFLPSTLTITANADPVLSGPGGAALNYTPSVRYAYVLALPASAGGYDLGNGTSFTTGTSSQLGINSTVPLNVTVLSIGNSVLSVTPQPLP